ncbi:MAG: flavin monoamine oxidase family protein [Sphingomonadaceae bacterium]
MRNYRICIVGAGLSGLYAAWLLEQHDIQDYVVLEARHVLGGRIASFGPAGGRDSLDLGPTWYWPEYQPHLQHLIQQLSLAAFPQHERADALWERAATAAPVRGPTYAAAPPSMRLSGGMSALTDALRRHTPAARIITGQAVRQIRRSDEYVELDSENASGAITTWRAQHVLLAVPPRVAQHLITFTPALPAALADDWRNTPTWMAPHAKYLATYDRAFWRDAGLSGKAVSASGPLGEIHDASTPDGTAALFGFFRIPAQVRRRVPDEELRAQCRAQLGRLFGSAAASPVDDVIKDWSTDVYTATAQDLLDGGQHAAAPKVSAASGPWHACLTGIASEWSPQFPGYVAGAIEAAERGVRRLIAGGVNVGNETSP